MLRIIEISLAALAFVLLSESNFFYALIGVPADLELEEDLLAYQDVIRGVYLMTYLVVIALSVLHWKKMILGVAAVWPVALLVGLAWLSLVWSTDPEITQRRAIAVTMTTLMGIYLFVRFEFDDMLRFLCFSFAIIVIGCFVWVVAFPSYAFHIDGPHAGVFRGIFFHKNTAGRVMVFGLSILIAAWYANCLHRGLLALIGVLALAVIALTTSKTALLGAFSLIMALMLLTALRGRAIKSAMITLSLFAVAWHLALLAYFTYEEVLLFLGRDPTLTGRTELWAHAIKIGLEQPFTGYGYSAFWSGDFSPGARYVIDWGIKQSHNSWIEIFVALGIPGLLIMLAIMLAMMFRAVFLARYYPSAAPAVLILGFSFVILTIGMAESLFLLRHTIYWLLLVAVAGCARALTARLGSQDRLDDEPAEPVPAPAYRRRVAL